MLNLNDEKAKDGDTKLKIMSVANELFARNGFDGVSIRDIAQAAEVNVASINYHFQNKLNLFHNIFEYNYRWMEDKVKEIAESEDLDTATMTYRLFQLFSGNALSLTNSFNLIINEHLAPDHDGLSNENEPFGPPGGQVLLQVITNEVGEQVPLEDREWAMRMIFSNIFHKAVMFNTKYLKKKCSGEDWMKPEVVERNLKMLGAALVNHIKK